MSGSLNKVMLIGRLGQDPEVRNTQDGRSLCTFSIATSESWNDKNTGEKREKTECQFPKAWRCQTNCRRSHNAQLRLSCPAWQCPRPALADKDRAGAALRGV